MTVKIHLDTGTLASAGLDGTIRLLEPSSGNTTILVQEATSTLGRKKG
jgi:hypothetical protein